MKLFIILLCSCLVPFAGYSQNALKESAISSYPDVKSYGALGDGRTDDTKAIQKCLNSLPLNGGGCVIISPGTYLVTKLRLPKLNYGQVVIIGYGATLKSITNDTILIRKPVDQAEALNKLTNSAINIEGLKITGNNGKAQVGIYIGGSYNSAVKNCMILGLQNGLELHFALMTVIDNCQINNCNNAGLIIDTGIGQWPKANGFNSQSNATHVSNCRFYNKKGQAYCIFTQNCSDLQFSNLAFEGADPQTGMYIGSNTTVFKGLVLNGLHNECRESDAIIKLNIPGYSGGVFKFSYIYNQMQTVVIDASQASGCLIAVDMMLYMPGGCIFKKGNASWTFSNNSLWNPNEAKYWDDRTLPKALKSN